MKNIFLITLFILSVAGAASACSSDCCAGKVACCCVAESEGVSAGMPEVYPNVGSQDCSCSGTLPLPVSQGNSAVLQQNTLLIKQALSGNMVNVSYNDCAGFFTLSAEYFLIKSYGIATPVHLRI